MTIWVLHAGTAREKKLLQDSSEVIQLQYGSEVILPQYRSDSSEVIQLQYGSEDAEEWWAVALGKVGQLWAVGA